MASLITANSQKDFRARISPKDSLSAIDILGPKGDRKNLLSPLYTTNGVLFPYTPSVTTGGVAEYDQTAFIHSNYAYNAYVRSTPKPITINAEFTAQTTDEAVYLLAVIHFFRSVTKMYFGVTPHEKAGTPPPVLVFSYLGQYMFDRVPVVIKNFEFTLPANIDYVQVGTSSALDINNPSSFHLELPASESTAGYSFVPTHLAITIDLETQYTPIKVRNEFNLDKFRKGELIGKGYI